MMKISIIVPIYNSECYLNRCLESIRIQTFEDIEVLLIDDGSTDNSAAICDKYTEIDSRFHYFHKKNGGVSSARNTGLRAAIGDWIMFVDSDDWISNNYCEIMLKTALGNNLDIIQCRRIEEKDNGVDKQSVTQEEYLKIYSFDDFNPSEENFYGTCWGFLFSAHLVQYLYFDERIDFTEDALFTVEAMNKSNRIGILNEYLYWYNLTSHNSLSTLIYDEKKMMIIESRTRQLELFAGKTGESTMQARLADGCFYLYSLGKTNDYFMKNHYKDISIIFRKYFLNWNTYRNDTLIHKIFGYSYFVSLKFGFFLRTIIRGWNEDRNIDNY